MEHMQTLHREALLQEKAFDSTTTTRLFQCSFYGVISVYSYIQSLVSNTP